jgi:hypothetical protein
MSFSVLSKATYVLMLTPYVNLPPIFRSSLKSIMLLGVVNSSLLKERGVEIFLQPFLKDMKLLEEGVELEVRNVKKMWYGILLNFSGDMPASNFVGGFKEGVGFANLPCRTCKIDRRINLHCVHRETMCTMRDKTSHDMEVTEIENARTQAERDAFSRDYGVNCRCPLSSLRNFDPTKCFMIDLMHVAYEGILNDKCCRLLKHLICDPIIKLNIDTVNYDISQLKS